MRPLIALLTDFGLSDHYVGTMKGVMLGICPDATLVDIAHELPAHDVATAAFELAASYRYFPPGTIFLVVVDPGVGSRRRALAVEAGDYRFVAPDNGVLTGVLNDMPARRSVELTSAHHALAAVSRTFEGRDRFAPAAAWLASGVDLAELGPAAGEPERLALPRPRVSEHAIAGEVIHVDRFGNLVTNIDRRTFNRFGERTAGEVELTAGRHGAVPLVSTYADVPPGELCGVFGSSDYLEVAANGTSAARALGLGRGSPVHVSRRA